MAIPTTLLLYALAFLIFRPIISLVQNYINARKTGLKIVLSPITPYTPFWSIFTPFLRPFLCNFTFFRALDFTCNWHDGNTLFSLYGANFIIVSPGLNVLLTSDPKSIEHVMKRWKEFVKPANVYQILGTFGQNVDTSNGDDWTRHRRIVAPCFGERGMSGVWDRAGGEARGMVERWVGKEGIDRGVEHGGIWKEEENEERVIGSLMQDTSTVALNVISSVAFENHDVNHPTPGHMLSLREALVTVMSTSISPSMETFMPWIRNLGLSSILPRNVKSLFLAMEEFSTYMDETIQRERSRRQIEGVEADDGKKLNLISTLIRANDLAETDQEKGVLLGKGKLSDIELRGNVFIFTVGGLESTAITLSYALVLLACNQDIQKWVCEEIDEVLGSLGHEEEMAYERAFPKMGRVMAVMYETLRLYGPSPPLPRVHHKPSSTPTFILPTTSNTTTSPSSSNPHLTLPSTTQIMLNSWASQSNPTYFPSPSTWNPKRWLDASTGSVLHPTSECGFYAWGHGPRICPGMKFSQVEFVGVLMNVLKGVSVELVERTDRERERIMGVLRDSVAEPLLLHVRRPEGVRVRVLERERKGLGMDGG